MANHSCKIVPTPIKSKSAIATEVEPTIQQLFNLSGKVTLVTGGTGYLGRSLAIALSKSPLVDVLFLLELVLDKNT